MPPLSLPEALSKLGVPPSEVQELNLDGKVKVTTVEGLEALTSLQSLSLSCCSIRRLAPGCFPGSLTGLVLSDNSVATGLDCLSNLAKLQHLDLAGNRFSRLEQLAPLTALQSLVSLDTEGCPVEDSADDYRDQVFKMLAVLPAFNYLNGVDKLGNERVVDEEVDGEDDDDEYEEEDAPAGEEGGEEEEEAGDEGDDDGGQEEAGGPGGAAGGDEGGDDEPGGDNDDEEDDDPEEEGEQEEEEEEGGELGTAALVQADPLDDDEEDYEEEEEPEDDELGDDDETPSGRKRKRGPKEYGDSDYEEEGDDSDEDYEGDE